MKKDILRLSFLCICMVAFMSSCRQDVAPPIRNVRFDPQLINRIQTADNSSCTNYSYTQGKDQILLGVVSTEEITIAFESSMTPEDQKDLIESYGFFKGFGHPKNTNGVVAYEVKLNSGLNCKQVELVIAELNKERGVSFAAPTFLNNKTGSTVPSSTANRVNFKLDN